MAGWIKLHRDITSHWIWDDKPFDRRSAWIDLILMANHKDNKVVLGNEIINVNRGSFITSEIKLMQRWGWSKTKVRSFLNLLENDEMIVKKSDKKKTTLKIVKYEVWQDSETTEEPQKDQEKTTKEPQKDTNKNVKNEKNEKNLNTIISFPVEEIPYKEIIDYLNSKVGASYKYTTGKTKECIHARWNEGFRLNDFKKVVDNKVYTWNKEPKPGERDMREYLRPITLFGTKFESYLNEKIKINNLKDIIEM